MELGVAVVVVGMEMTDRPEYPDWYRVTLKRHVGLDFPLTSPVRQEVIDWYCANSVSGSSRSNLSTFHGMKMSPVSVIHFQYEEDAVAFKLMFS